MKNHREKRKYIMTIDLDCITTNKFRVEVFEKMIEALCCAIANSHNKQTKVSCTWKLEDKAEEC
jgi:hypothetical protein